jgi:lipopolysaccharide/colanic/teichoic acid biosynthesis glycosyltransferase
MVFVTLFRFSNLISRGYLVLLTFLIPFVLLVFRNSEFLSSLLGRSVTNENYLTFNLKDDSIFRNLRLLTFRKELTNFNSVNLNNSKEIINLIDRANKNNNVNLIVLNFESKKKISKLLENYLINLNKKVLIISKDEVEYNNYFISRSEEISGYKLTYFNNDIQYGSKYILKRFLDVALALVALVVFSPIYILIALYLLILDGSPVVIKQTRIGLHGKSFKMFKFRTMKLNSHEQRDNLRKHSKNDAQIFKLDADPRVIKGASILRRFSLDELPQFLNVLLGNMSVVGPRPLFEEDTQLFNENYMRRLNVLPGITGLLQINERNTSEFETWYRYDIEYIENWSLLLDLKIIFKTPLSMFKKNEKGI